MLIGGKIKKIHSNKSGFSDILKNIINPGMIEGHFDYMIFSISL